MARLDPSTLTLGDAMDAYFAAAVLDGARLGNGRVVREVRQRFEGGVMTQTDTTVKAAGWSPSSSDIDLEDLRTLLTAKGVTIPTSGSKLSRLRSIIDQLAITVEG